MEPASLTKTVRGDLDWILLKALSKERKERYQTPTALSDDLLRYRMTSRSPQVNEHPLYFQKFVRRNRVPVIAGSLAILALLLDQLAQP